MGWYLLNLRQAKIARDRKARLHRVSREGTCFKLRDACNPGDQISGKGEGMFLFEEDDDERALEKASEVIKGLLGSNYDVKECDKCW